MSYLSTPDHRVETRQRLVPMQGPALAVLHAAAGTTRPQIPVETLTSVPLFQGVEPALLRQMADRAVVRKLPRHAMVLEQGSSDLGLFILLRGQAQVVRKGLQGRSLVIDQLRPGDHFGELSAVDEQAQYAGVRCTVPSEVLVIPRVDFIDCLHESQILLPALLQVMVERVRRKNRRITLLALHDVRGCVVQQLLDLAEWQDGQPVVRGRICRQAIADMIGASRAMVSRVMMALTRSGALQTLPDGSTVVRCEPTGPDDRAPQAPAARRTATG